ncbi:MAG: hypothetical protein M0T84_07030 [Betaproteobacteria bacterium]|nr:hypothetical protein [Betaproteobacteria bacterium]
MSSLDDLDLAAVDSAAPPETAKARSAIGVDPSTVAREVDGQGADEVVAKRAERWVGVIPESVKGSARDELESALDIAHYALALSSGDLMGRFQEISDSIAKAQGIDSSDPKVGLRAALKMARGITLRALSVNPFADSTKDVEQYVNRYQAYARTLGWSPEQIAAMAVSCVVSCQGDKRKGAALFAARVMGEMPERGHRGAASFEDLPPAGQQEVAHDHTAQPLFSAYEANARVTIVGYRDDDGELTPPAVISAADLHEDILEREERGRQADEALDCVDKAAAERLKDVDYAVYRIMREQAHMIHIRRDVAKDIEGRDSTLAKVIKARLQYQHEQGAYMAMSRVTKILQEGGVGPAESSEKAVARLAMSTAEAIEAGIAAKPRARGVNVEHD